MTHKIKSLALALFAIAAMNLAVVNGAQATQLHATSQGPYVLHGQQTGEITVTTNAGTIKCTQLTFEGTIEPTTDGTLTPTFTGCQAFGQAATLDVNGCKFTATSKDTAGVTYPNTKVSVDITGCTSGKVIEITSGICRMTLPVQHHINDITFSNNPIQTHDVNAHLTLTSVKYQADGPLCPQMPSGQTLTNGTVTGTATFQAYKITGSTQITHNGHQYTTHTRGEAVGLLVT